MNVVEILREHGDKGPEIVNAVEILRRECARTSLRKVSARMGYSITTLSFILNGKYGARLDKVAAAVLRMVAEYECPYLKVMMAPEMCKAIRDSKAPTHNPSKMGHWKACRTCKFNETSKEK